MRQHTLMDIVFVGFGSRVAALDRTDGQVLWKWKSPKGRCQFVSLLLDGDRLIVSVHGYMYCLDPLTGGQLWSNPMDGFGFGIPSLASLQGASGSTAAAAVIVQQQAAAAAGGGGAGA